MTNENIGTSSFMSKVKLLATIINQTKFSLTTVLIILLWISSIILSLLFDNGYIFNHKILIFNGKDIPLAFHLYRIIWGIFIVLLVLGNSIELLYNNLQQETYSIDPDREERILLKINYIYKIEFLLFGILVNIILLPLLSQFDVKTISEAIIYFSIAVVVCYIVEEVHKKANKYLETKSYSGLIEEIVNLLLVLMTFTFILLYVINISHHFFLIPRVRLRITLSFILFMCCLLVQFIYALNIANSRHSLNQHYKTKLVIMHIVFVLIIALLQYSLYVV